MVDHSNTESGSLEKSVLDSTSLNFSFTLPLLRITRLMWTWKILTFTTSLGEDMQDYADDEGCAREAEAINR
jgi:hypothetical protein